MSYFIVLLVFVACKQESKKSEETKIVKEKVSNNVSDWITLFDGSSFDNWRGYLTEDMYSEWTI